MNFELFPDLDLGEPGRANGGCTRPIGRRTRPRRRVLSPKPQRASTQTVLSEIRALLRDGLDNVVASLRRIERAARTQLDFQTVTNDQLERVLVRLVKLERAIGLVEQSSAPRISRHRPLD